MSLELIDSLSLPGDAAKPNDDAFAARAHAAVVMDGATGLGESLMPGPSDAAWVARFGANRVMTHSEESDAQEAVAASLRDTENSFVHLRRREPAETYEIPFASMMFVALNDAGFDALWFGDCAVLVEHPGGEVEIVGDALKKRGRARRPLGFSAGVARVAEPHQHREGRLAFRTGLARRRSRLCGARRCAGGH